MFEGKVDEEEHLVSDYACAWVKDVRPLQQAYQTATCLLASLHDLQIFRQGRLYVGACNLAFICTIIGLKTSVSQTALKYFAPNKPTFQTHYIFTHRPSYHTTIL
jgi:hypothetical protein